MRSFLSLVCGIVAVLAALLTVPAMWVSHNIASEDGYVAFAEPIARDSQFHDSLAGVLSDELVQNSALPADLQTVARTAIVRITKQVVDEPGFVAAWDDTQRQSHKIMLGEPRDLPPDLDSSQRFAIDLAPIGRFVVTRVNKDLPFALPAPQQMIVAVNGTTQQQMLDRIRQSPTYASKGLIAVGVFGALALAFARRRSVAVVWLGLGTIAAAGILKVAAAKGVPEILDRNTAPTPFARTLLDVFVERANASFDHWLLVLAVGGGIVVAVGGVARLVTSRSAD